ncbi:Imm49 family immunity protein [Corallococcus sicarius]|uniref:Uncharacterized protein n=1 Tax=Corallococcus sicarius TaxID=2316726 RepID=A0A3A8MRN4_9BACT|nr:Imm49 family immunity protein [Corallococcus sicarius]RKH30262.1 hypothetical protein D7X12_39135 [Corallococcus sicarius]
MSIKDLETLNGNLQHMLALKLQALRSQGPDAAKVLELARGYRQLGCGLLLATYDREDFFQCLFRAADAYLQFLEFQGARKELDPYYLARSRGTPLLDALAIGELRLAHRMGGHMAPRWTEGMEYEDDFCFFDVLPEFAATQPDESLLRQKLDRMERALEGAGSARFDILQAIASRDEARFEEALGALVEQWAEQVEKKRETSPSPLGRAFTLTEANVFIEGLALAQLAHRRGMRLRSEYRYVPPGLMGYSFSPPPRLSIWS